MTSYWYPKASKTQNFTSRFPGSTMNTDTVCIHSTEGTGWPSYNGGASAPNMTIRPNFTTKTVEVRQHFASNKSSRALENRSGGVQTNTQNTFQIELVGTCDPTTHKKWGNTPHIYMPEAPDWFLEGVADVLKWLKSVHPKFVIKDGAPRGWKAYPASYGSSSQRMSFTEWNKASGIIGHQHIPENSHGDPGLFPISRLVALAKGTAPAEPVDPPVVTPPKDVDELDPANYPPNGPSTGEQITWLGQRLVVHGYTGYKVGPGPEWGSADKAGVQWFQKKQGWNGSDADGYPGAETLKRLGTDPVTSAPPKELDKLDPSNYPPKGPSTGPQITWIGQRLVVHGYTGYKSGPGPTWSSADKAGVKWFQKKQGWSGSDADGYPGPQTLALLNKNPVIKPPPFTGPPAPTAPWFKLMSWNVSNNNAHGIKIWGTRRSKVVAAIKKEQPDVVCTQENTVKVGKLSGRDYIDSRLADYRLANGGDGRYIFFNKTVTRHGSGVFNLTPYYKGDDKQAAWAIGSIGQTGNQFLVTSYHLENEGTSDAYRVAQLKSCIKQAAAMAKKYNIPEHRIFHAGDTNFKSSASITVFEKLGWVDSFDSAKVAIHKSLRSLNSWRKVISGFRIDRVWVRKNRPVERAGQSTTLFTIADHNYQIITIGKIVS